MAWEGASLANFVCAGLDSMHDTTETSAVGLETETLTFSSTNIISSQVSWYRQSGPMDNVAIQAASTCGLFGVETAREGSVAPGHAGRR